MFDSQYPTASAAEILALLSQWVSQSQATQELTLQHFFNQTVPMHPSETGQLMGSSDKGNPVRNAC